MVERDQSPAGYKDGLEDAARVCEFIATLAQEKGMKPTVDALTLAAKSIRAYEPGILPEDRGR